MENNNLQAQVLDKLRESGDTVTVILKNGYRMDGRVLGFDDTVVMLTVGDKQKMVYKHMISTIVCEVDVM